jgi:hypothetical protein
MPASDKNDLDLRTTPHRLYGKRAVWWSLLAVLISVLIVACAYYELRPMINGQPATSGPVESPTANQ